MMTVDEILAGKNESPFKIGMHEWESRMSIEAHRLGCEIVAASRSTPYAPTPYAVQVLWTEKRGIVGRAIRYNRATERWEDVTDQKLLAELAKEAIFNEAARGLEDEEAARDVIFLDESRRLYDELLDKAYEHVDQYGADAYEAGRFVLRELLRWEPELRWRHHRNYRADPYDEEAAAGGAATASQEI